MEPVIVADRVAAGYSGRIVVRDVSFTLWPGEVLAILGPNGAGKTTLLKTLAGILKPIQGRILVAGLDIRYTSRRRIAQLVGYVPQTPASRVRITVLEYLLLALKAPSSSIVVRREHLIAVEEAMERLGIKHLASRGLWELSGGERQLVEIARAIAPKPKALLLDEPTSMLDVKHASKVVEAIAKLADEGTAIVLVTHDPNLALDLADTVLLLPPGSRPIYGQAKDLLTPEHLSPLYGAKLVSITVNGSRRIVSTPFIKRRRRGKGEQEDGFPEDKLRPKTQP